jgi:hypothetical protein
MSRSAMAALGAMLVVVPAATLVGTVDAEAQNHHGTIRPVYGGPPPPMLDAGVVRDAAVHTDASVPPDAASTAADARRLRAAERLRLRRLRDEARRPHPLYGASPKP